MRRCVSAPRHEGLDDHREKDARAREVEQADRQDVIGIVPADVGCRMPFAPLQEDPFGAPLSVVT
jgi:hypothetical protein